MTTTTDQIESYERSIAATESKIAELRSEIDNLIFTNRVNVRDLARLRLQQKLENSPKARWDRAVKSLRKDGVHFRTNIMQCCRGCVDAEKLNLKDESQPYGWTFGGQGNWIKFNEDGLPYTSVEPHTRRRFGYDYDSPKSAMINWGNGSAEKIVAAFQAEGFQVNWNGSEYQCVEVVF